MFCKSFNVRCVTYSDAQRFSFFGLKICLRLTKKINKKNPTCAAVTVRKFVESIKKFESLLSKPVKIYC